MFELSNPTFSPSTPNSRHGVDRLEVKPEGATLLGSGPSPALAATNRADLL